MLAGSTPALSQQKDLSGLFDSGYLLNDSNSDSLMDEVNGKIVIPDNPSEAQIIAASNIAARLGFETTAMDLNMAVFASELSSDPSFVSIVIEPNENTLILAPGQGIISLLGSDYPNGGIQVSGYDASGLLAASNYLSGRFPLVGTDKDFDLEALKEKIKKGLEDDSVAVKDIRVQSIAVSSGKAGITSAKLEINGTGKYFENNFTISEKKKKKWMNAFTGNGAYRLVLVFKNGPELVLQSDENQPTEEKRDNGKAKSASAFFDVSELYTINGIYTDTKKDKIPDDSRGYIAYSGTEGAKELINFAARIGLETAGIKLPIVFPAYDTDNLDHAGFPILIGVESRVKGKLEVSDKQITKTENGLIEIRKDLFGEDSNGLVITGKSEKELQAALSYATKHIPYVWDFGKGNLTLEEVQTEARRFFQGVTAEGQAANGIEKIETWLNRLRDKDIDDVDIKLAVKDVPDGLDSFIEKLIKSQTSAKNIQVETFKTGFGDGQNIFTEEVTFPWEVDDFWKGFNQKVLPELTTGAKGSILVRVSESPEIREQIKKDIQNKLKEKNIDKDDFSIHVINAYKQGFSWLENIVIPQLKGKSVASVNIRYKHLRDSEEIKWQATAAKTRWLQEIYPIDGILLNELGVPLADITFTPAYSPEHTYVFEAFDKKGKLIFEDSFDPEYVVRPYFDLFPKYDSVRVSTGWYSAEINGEIVADERVKTDLERFWDHMQTSTYSKVLDYVMDIQDGKPDPDLAPYFDELKFEISLSEPNRQLGILKEQITPLEALHEDIYFETILFFNLIGNRYGVGRLSYPGRILPFMMPPQEGKDGKAKITFTGKEEGRPQVRLRYKESGSIKEFSYELPNINVKEPALVGLEIGAGAKIKNLIFDVSVDKEKNPFEELKERGSESYIDNAFVSADRLSGMVDVLKQMKQEKLFDSSLSISGIGQITFRFSEEDSTKWSIENNLPATQNKQALVRQAPLDGDFNYKGENLVQWDTPIPPAENNEILAKLNTFDNIHVYYAATSMLGEKVYAMDLMPPVNSQFISQAKLNALKPTLFISGRQHANEFSSTSHILKLAEKIATDPEYKKYLDRVNLVLHPITNPDGANLSVEMNNINNYYMHHAGYLGPLGVDVTRDQNNEDPRYEVAKVRREIHNTWLPDVYINMHGYPPHEWVQYFAGYSAWMMSRERGPRSNNYWIPRGYFLTGFSWYDNDDFPSSEDLSFALLDSISSHVNGVPKMHNVNMEMQARYKKYRSHEDAYGEFYKNDIWVNSPLKGRESTGNGYSDPRITYFTLTSEAPDEPARGDWMKMNAAAGVAHSTGALQYLYYGKSEETEVVKTANGRTHRSKYRVKPVLPAILFEKYKSEKQ